MESSLSEEWNIISKLLQQKQSLDEELYNKIDSYFKAIEKSDIKSKYKTFESNSIIPSSCTHGYNLKKYLGCGAFGNVYQACKRRSSNETYLKSKSAGRKVIDEAENDCNYIVKVIALGAPYMPNPYISSTEATEDTNKIVEKSVRDFFNEAKISQFMGSLGISPKVYDYWICQGNNIYRSPCVHGWLSGWLGFISSEKLDLTLREWLNDNRNNSWSTPVKFQDTKSFMDMMSAITNRLKEKAEIMIDEGYMHGDVNFDNIMLRIESPDVFFIDFGVVSELKNDEEKNEARLEMFRNIDDLLPLYLRIYG